MARTIVGINSPQAVKKWSGMLQVATNKTSYFTSVFMGDGKRSRTPIQRITDLEKDRGDTITVDLLMPLKMEPVIGSDNLDGKEEEMRYFTDKVLVEQIRAGVDCGGTMDRKRTLRDLREDALEASKDWWARMYDELFFIYLSGARGVGGGYVWSDTNPYFANTSAVTAPDSAHQMYASTATSKATITSAMVMDTRMIDRAVARAETMGGDTSDDISMVKCHVGDGSSADGKYVCLMHTFQYDAFRANGATGQFLDIQKAAAASEGQRNTIFTRGKVEYNGVIVHTHRNVVQFNDYGAGANLPAARALFMGAQAGLISFGSPGSGLRMDWTEEIKDHGDKIKIGSKAIVGVKKATYKSADNSISKDFGVMALDTYNANPG